MTNPFSGPAGAALAEAAMMVLERNMVGRETLEDFDALKRHNRAQIQRYVEHIREARYPSSAGSMVDTLTFTGKPESSAPHSHRGELIMDDDDLKDAASLLNPLIETWLRWYRSDWYYLIERAPLEAENWKAGDSQDDREAMAEYRQVLDKLSERLEKKHPGRRIEVPASPQTEPAKSKVHARNRDNNLRKRYGAQDAYRVIYPKWLIFRKRNMDMSEAKAMRAFRVHYERVHKDTISVAKIRRAVRFCEGESTERFADDGSWWRDFGGVA